MSIKRYGTEGGVGTGGQPLPFARAVQAGGWLYVAGQTPMVDGEVVEGGIVEQLRLAIGNCLEIMAEAGYQPADVVHAQVILTDARYFALTSNNIISYITKMIVTVMAGMFVCGLLGRFWNRYNWQGAVATLIAASSTSVAIIMNEAWMAYWGNPSIPAVLAALGTGVVVILLTPASQVTREQALALLARERESMEGSVERPLGQVPAASAALS
jgi:enamine deaminase RidA (YjgF/YER057c/UK114 family)